MYQKQPSWPLLFIRAYVCVDPGNIQKKFIYPKLKKGKQEVGDLSDNKYNYKERKGRETNNKKKSK